MSRIRTLMLKLSVDDFEEIATAIESEGFKIMARGYGSDEDDDFAEVLPEDRGPEVFDPSEFRLATWK